MTLREQEQFLRDFSGFMCKYEIWGSLLVCDEKREKNLVKFSNAGGEEMTGNNKKSEIKVA